MMRLSGSIRLCAFFAEKPSRVFHLSQVQCLSFCVILHTQYAARSPAVAFLKFLSFSEADNPRPCKHLRKFDSSLPRQVIDY